MLGSTVGNAGFEVGIKFGGESTVTIGGQSLTDYVAQKQDKNTLLSDVYPIGSVITTAYDVNPDEYIENTTWTNIGSMELSENHTLYFWERQF